MLAHLVDMQHAEGEGIFLPGDMPVEHLLEEEFRIARDSLAGVVPAHLRGKISDVISGLKGRMDAAVRRYRDVQGPSETQGTAPGSGIRDCYMETGKQLVPRTSEEAGLLPSVGPAQRPRQGLNWVEAVQRVLPWVPCGMLEQGKCPPALMANVAAPPVTRVAKGKYGYLPQWAHELVDMTGNLPYDSDQYMGFVGVGNCVTEAIMDTGGARCMMDAATAVKLGVPYIPAHDREFGTFIGVGGQPTAYKGVSDGAVQLRFSGGVVMYCPRVKIINHADPLFIVGADVLHAGRAPHVWDWRSIGAEPGTGGRGV